MSPLPRPPRRNPRRGQVGVHRPARPAPDTPAEVLEAAADVSRETSAKDAESAAWAALQPQTGTPGGGWEAEALAALQPVAPPLRKDQVARLEALTAQWERRVRLEDPPDVTLLYTSPPPPPRPGPLEPPPSPPPVPDAAVVAGRSADLAEPPAPAPAPAPGPGPGSARRVSDWTSRHDPRSLAYAVRERLGRAVPLQDVSLDGGPVLDQGTVPPLSVIDASACVGMACAAAANVLMVRAGHPDAYLRETDARELYHAAQKLDQVHGEAYAGTSVLGGMKAGQSAGWWDAYLWALGGVRDVAQVLIQLRLAVVIGVPWSEGCENPDAAGVITPGGASMSGHSLAVTGLRHQVRGARPGPWFELQQSRGPAEGVGGRVYLHHKDLARLLAGRGEAAVPLPRDLS